MRSPIRFLMMHNLGNSVFTIAPEREVEADRTLDNFDLIFTGQRRWEVYADPATREIFVSRGAVELIWCASLAHFLFYTRAVQGKRFDKPGEIDLRADARIRDALDLLHWSLECHLKGDESDNWPTNLPRPLESPIKESDENVADELCLVSCAYLLHHELAHLRLRHSAGVSDELSLSQEKEADIEAAQWILDGIDAEDPRFVKRMLGIVQAFLLTTAYGLYGGNLGGKSHPFSHDRLYTLLNRFVGNASHVTKGMAFAVLDLHFQNSGRRLTKQRFADPEEALDALCDQLASEVHARQELSARSLV